MGSVGLSWHSKWQPVHICLWITGYLNSASLYFHSFSPSCSLSSPRGVLLGSPGLAPTSYLPIATSWVAEIRAVHHYTWLLFSFLRGSGRRGNNQKTKPWVKRMCVDFKVDKSLLVGDFWKLAEVGVWVWCGRPEPDVSLKRHGVSMYRNHFKKKFSAAGLTWKLLVTVMTQ